MPGAAEQRRPHEVRHVLATEGSAVDCGVRRTREGVGQDATRNRQRAGERTDLNTDSRALRTADDRRRGWLDAKTDIRVRGPGSWRAA